MKSPKEPIENALAEISGVYAGLALMLEKRKALPAAMHAFAMKLQRGSKILEDYVNEVSK